MSGSNTLPNIPVNDTGVPECIICTYVLGTPRDDGSVEYGTLLPCNHMFGNRCLAAAVQEKPRCPICRREIHADIRASLHAHETDGVATGDAPADMRHGRSWRELDEEETRRNAVQMGSPGVEYPARASSVSSRRDAFSAASALAPWMDYHNARANNEPNRRNYPGAIVLSDESRERSEQQLRERVWVRSQYPRSESQIDREYFQPENEGSRAYCEWVALRGRREAESSREDRVSFRHPHLEESFSLSYTPTPTPTSRDYNVIVREPARNPYYPHEARAIAAALDDPNYFHHPGWEQSSSAAANRGYNVIERSPGHLSYSSHGPRTSRFIHESRARPSATDSTRPHRHQSYHSSNASRRPEYESELRYRHRNSNGSASWQYLVEVFRNPLRDLEDEDEDERF